MTVATKRRGEIRPISSLPAAPAGTKVLEVDIAGVAYQASAASIAPASGLDIYNQLTSFQFPFDVDFADLKGNRAPNIGAGCSISALQSRFGVASALFSGAASAIVKYNSMIVSGDASCEFRMFPFTLEGWFRCPPAGQPQFATLVERDPSSGGGWALIINDTGANTGDLAFYVSLGTSKVCKSAVGFNDNVWHHVAVVRCLSTFMMFVDGVFQSTLSVTFTSFDVLAASTAGLWFGGSAIASRNLVGNLQDWRLVRGLALYTCSFTPPTTPFPTS